MFRILSTLGAVESAVGTVCSERLYRAVSGILGEQLPTAAIEVVLDGLALRLGLMARDKFVGYLQVSTEKQGQSGLGIEAQRKAIDDYLNGGRWELLAEYVEIGSGKRSDRPELAKALAHAKATGATLAIATLDRLSRNVAFISNLMESDVDSSRPICHGEPADGSRPSGRRRA